MSPHDKCKGCGAPIIWIRTKDGKHMPCNPEDIEIDIAGAKTTAIITEDGRLEFGSPVNPNDLFPPTMTVKGRVSHFATCPAAGKFRKG
jgi:hypothetical protein